MNADRGPTSPSALELIGAFESTYMPAHDRDILETSGHTENRVADLHLLATAGVRRLRYPIRWHRIETEPGRYDWSETDDVVGHMLDEGLTPIADLVHHTSYPAWLTGGFADPRFRDAYLRYCEAFALRYPGVREYTAFNEPFATLFLSGHEAIWPPYLSGVPGFVRLMRNVLPAVAEASVMLADLLPGARHVYVDTCEGHSASDPGAVWYAVLADDRRFIALDLVLGRDLDEGRPFVRELLEHGGEDLMAMASGRVDVLGLDYYAHSEWAFRSVADGVAPPRGRRRPGDEPIAGSAPSPHPRGLAALVREYGARYPDLPLILSETNIRGAPSDRATWLRHTLEQCEMAVAAGCDLSAYCWFPFIDSLDWNSLLARCDGCIDPVGVMWLCEDRLRNASSMSTSYSRAAAGARAAELPAFRFTPPVAEWLRGLLPLMSHYPWRPAPQEEAIHMERDVVRARIDEVER